MNVTNANLIHFVDESGVNMSAIIKDGQIERSCRTEFEHDLVKAWNSEQRQISRRKNAKRFNDANTIYHRFNLNRIKDADIQNHLDNLDIPKSQYIKQLIREDMKRYNQNGG